MVHDPSLSENAAQQGGSMRRQRRVALRAASVAFVAALVSGSVVLGRLPATDFRTDAARERAEVTLAEPDGEAVPTLGAEARSHWREALLEAFPDWSAERPLGSPGLPTPFARQDLPLQGQDPAPQELPAPAEPGRSAQSVPLPVPRPPEFRRPIGPDTIRRAERQASRRSRTAAVPAPAADDRNFFEKLFGVERAATPALAYAALETPSPAALPRPRLVPQPNPDPAATAIYDISAQVVTLPNGTRLEAHSGLGETMDDPRNVHIRMRGATPPGTYELTEREDLFHGVRAIRLTPVGGSAAVYGRVGLLAHTYMLGPNGASNGCVSFKDYQAFLQAYLRGEIQRLVVVPGRGQDAAPGLAQRAQPASGRSARLGNDV